MLREGSAIRFEQLVDIAGAHAVAQSQSRSPHVAIGESFRDISLDRAESCGLQSAPASDLDGIASCPNDDGRQIMNMRDDCTLQIWRAQSVLVLKRSEIADKQSHHAGITR